MLKILIASLATMAVVAGLAVFLAKSESNDGPAPVIFKFKGVVVDGDGNPMETGVTLGMTVGATSSGTLHDTTIEQTTNGKFDFKSPKCYAAQIYIGFPGYKMQSFSYNDPQKVPAFLRIVLLKAGPETAPVQAPLVGAFLAMPRAGVIDCYKSVRLTLKQDGTAVADINLATGAPFTVEGTWTADKQHPTDRVRLILDAEASTPDPLHFLGHAVVLEYMDFGSRVSFMDGVLPFVRVSER